MKRLVLLFCIIPSLALSDIIYVDASRPNDSGDGTSWTNAKKLLQSALAIASSGDEIRVAEGTYYPSGGTFQLVNGVTIYGGYPAGGGARDVNTHETILNGDLDLSGDKTSNDANHVVTGANDAILDGFTIKNGYANGSGSDLLGAGLYFYHTGENTTINNCIISNNYAEDGAGMHNTSSDPTITNCTFSNNTASDEGGGIINGENSNPTITNCSFYDNSAVEEGGGIMNSNSDPTITTCYFSTNSTEDCGGGIHNANSDPTVNNCIFYNNTADVDGGGICNKSTATPIVTNCTFSNNNATGNGDGIANRYSSDLTVKNCIFWGSNDQIYNDNSTIAVTFSDVQQSSGTYSGTGNINNNPLFQNVDNENFLLSDGSPCLGTGSTPDAANVPVTDKDGRSRPLPALASQVDMGAYEQYDSDASLPVELSSFIANLEMDKIILEWVTESEVNNSHFLLDKSINKIDFFTLAKVPGQGNSTTRTKYKYNDENVINSETYYYRLASCDLLGNIEYEDAIYITFQNVANVKPKKFFLYQNYPNPFNPNTKIYFDLPKEALVTVKIYNLKGTLVKTLLCQNFEPGKYEISWNGTDEFGIEVSSGVYVYSIQADNFYQSKKMILLH